MDDPLTDKIRANLEQVYERILRAASGAGRNPEEIRLVVVTKTHPVESIRAAVQAGARILGENYAEEAVQKMKNLESAQPVEWHMIGHVQSRKARLVCEHFDLVHSLDSLRLAGRYELFAAEAGRVLPVLLEFNVGGEESKSGWDASEPDRWEDLLPEISQIASMPHLEVRGLMTMPPLFSGGELTRPYFRKLFQLRQFLAGQFPEKRWDELSMGTSADYEAAIQEGATLVRVGQAILGPRPPRGL